MHPRAETPRGQAAEALGLKRKRDATDAAAADGDAVVEGDEHKDKKIKLEHLTQPRTSGRVPRRGLGLELSRRRSSRLCRSLRQ